MFSGIRDLQEWYPFLIPEEDYDPVPPIVYATLDMLVRIVLPSGDKPYALSLESGNLVDSVSLLTVENNTALIRCEGAVFDNGRLDIEAEVIVGEDAPGKPDKSYLVMREYTEFSGRLQIHPRCIVFMQKAPVLELYTRYDVNVAEDSHLRSLTVGDPMMFEDGNNAALSWTGDGIAYSGVPGAGRGLWQYAPFSNYWGTWPRHGSVGLRGVNGYTDVDIVGSPTISVEAEEDASGDIIMRIRPVLDSSGSESDSSSSSQAQG